MKFPNIVFATVLIFLCANVRGEEPEGKRRLGDLGAIAASQTVSAEQVKLLSDAVVDEDYRIQTAGILIVNSKGGAIRKELTPKIIAKFKSSGYPGRIWLMRAFISGDVPDEIVELLRQDLMSPERPKVTGALDAINECPISVKLLRSDLMELYEKRNFNILVTCYIIRTITKTTSVIKGAFDELPIWEFITKASVEEDVHIRGTAMAGLADIAPVLSNERRKLCIEMLSKSFEDESELVQYAGVLSFAIITGDRSDKISSKLAALCLTKDRMLQNIFFNDLGALGADVDEMVKRVIDQAGDSMTAEMRVSYKKWLEERADKK